MPCWGWGRLSGREGTAHDAKAGGTKFGVRPGQILSDHLDALLAGECLDILLIVFVVALKCLCFFLLQFQGFLFFVVLRLLSPLVLHYLVIVGRYLHPIRNAERPHPTPKVVGYAQIAELFQLQAAPEFFPAGNDLILPLLYQLFSQPVSRLQRGLAYIRVDLCTEFP